MKRRIKITAFFVLLVAVFAVTAYAKEIAFGIAPNAGENGNGKVWVTSNTKDRQDNIWLITNYNNTSEGSIWFIEYHDVVGFRVYKNDKQTQVSNYHYFTRYVDDYPLEYTSTPSRRSTLWLRSQADSTSNRTSFAFKGQWFT